MFIFVALLNVKDYYYEENLSIITHVFLFQACTSDMEEILQVGEVETSKVTTRQASDGEYDLLGFSYDITGDYLHVDNAKKMVVDIKSFIE